MDWIRLLAPGLAGALGTVFFVWLINRRGSGEAPRTRLETGRMVFWFLVLFAPVLLVLAVVGGHDIPVGDADDAPNLLLGVGVGIFIFGLGLGAIWQAWDSRSRWAEWDERTLTVHKGKGPAKTYQWDEVSSYAYITLMQANEIRFDDGYKFMFFDMMTGSKELLELCDAQIQNRYEG